MVFQQGHTNYYSCTWQSLPSGEKMVICLSKPALLPRDIFKQSKCALQGSNHNQMNTDKLQNQNEEVAIWYKRAEWLQQVLELLPTRQCCPKSKSLKAKLPMTSRMRRRSVCRVILCEQRRRHRKLLKFDEDKVWVGDQASLNIFETIKVSGF